MNRRHFLATATAVSAFPTATLATPSVFGLRAEKVTGQVLPVGDGVTQMFGFNGSMPGPEIKARRNEMLSIDVENGLGVGTAVHWHGIRLRNAMDGVPGLTQPLIQPSEEMRYDFVPPDAGTYWYHSHHMSHEQVARGLMGPLIIEDDTPPDVDQDITVLISDWHLADDGSLTEEFGNRHSLAHAGYMGNYARAFLSLDSVRQGDRVRLRLINAATNRIFPLGFGGATGHLVALDGMALPRPRSVDEVVLAPAQRADVIVDLDEPFRFEMKTRQGAYPLADIAVSGKNRDRTAGPVDPLGPHGVPHPGDPSQRLTLTMMGGAMSGRHGGDDIWAFNDRSGLPDTPFASFEQGETAQITLVNDTAFPHGIHLHGHHFHEISRDGSLGDLRDTTLVGAGESRDIRCLFDNPGRWLIHCHMLSHQAAGMKTWVEVT